MARNPWCWFLLLAATPLAAEPLNNTDRQLLLERLAELKEAAEGREGGRISTALAALRPAVASGEAAVSLYLKCVEKLEFEEQHRKSQEFREWKRRQKDRLSDPGTRLAMQLQIQWLVLTLEVAADPEKITDMAPKAANALDAIFKNADHLAGHQNTLRRSVTSTVFARAYNVSRLDLGDWPTNPLALEDIYDKVILPPLRKPDHIEALRTAWLKRIQHEAIIREYWSGWNSNGRGNSSQSPRPPAFEKFLTDERPHLLWRMEEDLFNAGDQQKAALRMLDHLKRYVSHPRAPDWTDRFIALISPKPDRETGTDDSTEPVDPDPWENL